LTANVTLDIFATHLFTSSADITSAFDTQLEFKNVESTYFERLGATRYMITEYANVELPMLQFEISPGAALAFLYNADRIDSNAIMRSCFVTWSGSNGCFDDTVDGLLKPSVSAPPSLPLPSWWTYKMYADWTTLNRVTLTSDSIAVVGFAGYSESLHLAQILVGNHDVCVSVHNCDSAQLTLNISGIAASFGIDKVDSSGLVRSVVMVIASTLNDTTDVSATAQPALIVVSNSSAVLAVDTLGLGSVELQFNVPPQRVMSVSIVPDDAHLTCLLQSEYLTAFVSASYVNCISSIPQTSSTSTLQKSVYFVFFLLIFLCQD